jgi:uncharacterized protein YxeA
MKKIIIFIVVTISIICIGIYVYMNKNDEFVVRYSLHPDSNGSDHDDLTTIKSNILKKYFIKWQKQVKNLKPDSTWTNKY